MTKLIALIILITTVSATARTFKKMGVPKGLETHLNEILRSGNSLHEACVKSQGDQVDQSLMQLIGAIGEARKQSRLMGLQQTHIDRILIVTEGSVERARKKQGDARTEALKKTFTELVQIEQVFQLDKYHIFFCGKDQAVWLQKSSKPQNPIHPKDLKTCGKLVQ